MKAKVLKTFIDLKSNVIHRKGDEIEVTKARLVEINKTEFGKLVQEVKQTSKK